MLEIVADTKGFLHIYIYNYIYIPVYIYIYYKYIIYIYILYIICCIYILRGENATH